ncbi:acyl-CoA dehydrogenase family protein [Halioglobus pacificus]|uniref:Acyl-CoA dehydrogenase n=1 Tax=Parahalioglobus pacificus TaxID=930806 RepID=A0A918XG68_9GAMM|nr:acyl-CoA dehydrogenase family protein [Halioglobus pacificus]GHD30596.1 acyl-CoA dehydrogenase [Halioglobus pacificus]
MRIFTEEQTMFRQAYRKFLETEVAPHMAEYNEKGIVDREIFRKAGEQGFLMVWPEEKYGGLGDNDFRYEQIIIEESVRAGIGGWGNTLHSRLIGPYFTKLGTEEQKQRWLPKCVSGETVLAVAMTEPDAGSDLSGMRSNIVDAGDHYVLNGAKTYISNGINADVVIVAAKNDPENNPYAVTLMVVERGMDGFERGRNLEKMGGHAQDTAELFFNDVKVPKENVLGEVGKGFYYLMHGLAEERLIVAVGSTAHARKAFDVTRDFVMQRKVFGKPLSAMQNTQFKMAEMDAEIDVVQTYVDHCVYQHNDGKLDANMAAKAKLLSTELEWKMLDLGVQLHGGAGYMREYPICDMFTGARINRILAGSNEIMKYVIGRDIFDDAYSSMLD